MRKDQRLRKTADFSTVRREGRSWSNPYLVLIARRNCKDSTRFGFSVGKRVGNAVVRNKLKRRMREISRLSCIENGWDLVFIARKDAPSIDFLHLRQAMVRLLRRAGVGDSAADTTGC